MAKTIKTRLEALEGQDSERPLIMAIKGLDGIAVEGETLTEAEFKRRYPEDRYTVYMQSVGMEVGKL